MSNMPDNSIDCVITSPPYDDLKGYNGYSFEFEKVAVELVRIIKPHGVIVWVVGDQCKNGSESGTSFRQALHFISLGLKLHDTMIYEKNSSTFPAQANSNRYTQIFEYMFVLSKGKPNATLLKDKENKWAGHKDYSGKLKNPVPSHSPRTNIWRYVTSKNSSGHPAPFPAELVKDHLLTWTQEEDLVYDPFMDSGTTAIVCEQMQRRWIGSEISTDYCNAALERVFGKK